MAFARQSCSSAALLVLSLGLLCAPAAHADTRHYVLTEASTITSRDGLTSTTERLSGSFDVTVLPLSSVNDVAAVTNVKLVSQSFEVSGNGFLQRFGRDRQALVLDARINDAPVWLTSGRRQYADATNITIALSSYAGSGLYALVISAAPVDEEPQDSDADHVADGQDNCPTAANPEQAETDADGIGDACDRCPDTPPDSPVTASGCNVAQLCPCEESRDGTPWETQKDYLQCVVRAVRELYNDGQVSKQERRKILRRAATSTCGRTVVALGR